MGQYTSYWLYQKYETRGSQDPIPCYPNVYSVDGDGAMPLVVKNEDDTQCGYIPPVEPVYKWVNIPITQDYICDDCSEVEYRWINMDVNTDYYCEGTTKYYKQKKQQSSDGGQTWSDVVPAEYRKGGVAEQQSTDCGYVPPTPTGKKLVATYSDSRTYEVDCNSSTALTSGETKPSGYQASAMTNAVIGDCVTSIGDEAFSNCTSLTSCTIGTGVTSIGNSTFTYCSGLTSATIPNSVTSIGEWAFAYCSGLTSVTIGNSVTSIGEYAFYWCARLTSVTIPNSVTYIGVEGFDHCTGLTSVTIGSGITSIDRHAFVHCYNLTSITCLATTPPSLGSDRVFLDTNDCPIYVPSQSVNAYKSAVTWTNFASRIYPIP